jgi:hypothetical protein
MRVYHLQIFMWIVGIRIILCKTKDEDHMQGIQARRPNVGAGCGCKCRVNSEHLTPVDYHHPHMFYRAGTHFHIGMYHLSKSPDGVTTNKLVEF